MDVTLNGGVIRRYMCFASKVYVAGDAGLHSSGGLSCGAGGTSRCKKATAFGHAAAGVT